jgi:hypothetical protein
MTANTMADELEKLLDRSDSFGSPGYEDFEISSVLTEAQENYIKTFLSSLNNRKRQGFQETEIRNQGLSALIKAGITIPVSSNQSGVLANGKFFDLPTDFMYTIYEEAVLDQVVCNTEDPIVAEVRVVGYNEINRLIRNKYKKPYFKDYGEAVVWRTEFSREVTGILPSAPATNKRHQLLTDGSFEIDQYTIMYLKNPSQIVVDRDTTTNQRNCELDESTHWIIVESAKSLMMERVKEQKIQNIESLKDLE